MAKTELLQSIWRRYQNENDHEPIGTRQVVDWAVQKGLLELPRVDPYDVLASQMAKALREETSVDKHGRIYRVNHSARINKDGTQMTFWAIMGYANREHMEKSFAQRREQIVGECLSLKSDIDVYNEKHPNDNPIQLELDFTEDVSERLILKNIKIFSSELEQLT
jgi:hypothetical protein